MNSIALERHESLRAVAPKSGGKRITALVAGFIGVTAAALTFVPWQQTIIANGQVSIYGAMNRQQNIEAQIPGRLVSWHTQEGQTVKKGDLIARLRDIDSKFLDANQAKRLAEQDAALTEQAARIAARVGKLDSQLRSLEESRESAISTARQRVEQTRQRRKAAAQSLLQARKSFEIARDVGRATAGERLLQAGDRVRQAEQALLAAKQDEATSRLQRDRVAELYRLDLRSKRDDELAENDLVSKRVRVRQAEDAVTIARRDAKVGRLAQNQTNLELDRAGAAVESAQASREIADRDIAASQFDLSKVMTDTTASLSSLEAGRESARESGAKIIADRAKLAVDRRNLAARTRQQVVTAPCAGRVVRLFKGGAGETVKAGDVLATILPDSRDQAVELSVADNDVPLISEGRHVRLQFAGWPALQFTGFPSVATGTFAGRIRVIDALDDGMARFRVIVEPDFAAIKSGKEPPWPAPNLLRPGGEATGWILLDTVPLGWELWRQFNAFPPTVKRAPVGEKGKTPKPAGKDGDRDGEKDAGYIKLKSK